MYLVLSEDQQRDPSVPYSRARSMCIEDRYEYLLEYPEWFESLTRYSNDGDYERFLERGYCVSPDTAIYVGALEGFEGFKSRFVDFWERMLKGEKLHIQSISSSYADLSHVQWFDVVLRLLWSGRRLPELINNSLYVDIFFWYYGKTYDPNREFPVTFGEKRWRPLVKVDIDYMSHRLRGGIVNLLFEPQGSFCGDRSGMRISALLEYALSLIPHIDARCYDLKLPKRRDDTCMPGGRVTVRSAQSSFRRLVGKLNGIPTLWDIEEDGLDQVVIVDKKLHNWFKEEFELRVDSRRYQKLVDYIRDVGPEYVL